MLARRDVSPESYGMKEQFNGVEGRARRGNADWLATVMVALAKLAINASVSKKAAAAPL
jgi:hypothetical protein